MSEKVIVNGKVVALEEGLVSLDDRGYTLGDGLFETIALVGGKPFRPERHFDRLSAGAKTISLSLPFDGQTLYGWLDLLIDQNQIDRGVARLTVTKGIGPRGYISPEAAVPFVTMTCRPFDPMEAKRWEGGIALALSPYKKDPISPFCRLKSISSLERIMTLDQAHQAGAEEVVTLTLDGHISSGVGHNIFWVNQGELFTPSQECAILPGVARAEVIDIAQDEAIGLHQGAWPLAALKEAEEVFVTNALAQVTPVRVVDGHIFRHVPGEITRRIASLFKERAGAV